jgi:hypothetical protein
MPQEQTFKAMIAHLGQASCEPAFAQVEAQTKISPVFAREWSLRSARAATISEA